ncbi:MAG: arsenate reductase ArsC [Rhodospirillales bacterium]|nr:arsenate reductase ArsC [Rhodospirillales bacterium]
MPEQTRNVLFLCTGNSCRSIMAECALNRLGQGRFRAFSAGSHPTGRVHPLAIDLLRQLNYPTGGLRSKDWSEFAEAPAQGRAPVMDFVFTVCDNAAGEVCPVWPGQPVTAHWGFPDPAAFEGSEAETRAVFAEVYGQIERRISIFVSLPFEALDRLALKRRLDELGRKLPESE